MFPSVDASGYTKFTDETVMTWMIMKTWLAFFLTSKIFHSTRLTGFRRAQWCSQDKSLRGAMASAGVGAGAAKPQRGQEAEPLKESRKFCSVKLKAFYVNEGEILRQFYGWSSPGSIIDNFCIWNLLSKHWGQETDWEQTDYVLENWAMIALWVKWLIISSTGGVQSLWAWIRINGFRRSPCCGRSSVCFG